MLHRSIVVIIATLSMVAFHPASARAEPGAAALPPELAAALDDYNRSTIAKDIASLSKLVSNDYMLVNSDGSTQDKSSYLSDFKMAGFDIEPYSIENPFYRVEIDAALTSWTMHLNWTQDGRHQSRHLRISHYWILRDSKWQVAFTQLTRLPDEPSK